MNDILSQPTISLPELGRLLGVSEPVIRERHRRGELEALGIRVLTLGRKHRVVTSTVREVLGIDADRQSPPFEDSSADPFGIGRTH